jgi:hypothetical protein
MTGYKMDVLVACRERTKKSSIRGNPGLWRFNLPGFAMFNLPAFFLTKNNNVETWSV